MDGQGGIWCLESRVRERISNREQVLRNEAIRQTDRPGPNQAVSHNDSRKSLHAFQRGQVSPHPYPCHQSYDNPQLRSHFLHVIKDGSVSTIDHQISEVGPLKLSQSMQDASPLNCQSDDDGQAYQYTMQVCPPKGHRKSPASSQGRPETPSSIASAGTAAKIRFADDH